MQDQSSATPKEILEFLGDNLVRWISQVELLFKMINTLEWNFEYAMLS